MATEVFCFLLLVVSCCISVDRDLGLPGIIDFFWVTCSLSYVYEARVLYYYMSF
jgi:hypothetical protein